MLSVRFFMILWCALFIAADAMAETNVLVISGSTRTGSFNKKLARQAGEIAKANGANVSYIDLKDYALPLYDEDLEAKGQPEMAKSLRQQMMKSNVILISSPEYNNSLSAVLKNAIDWATRDEKGKPSRDAFKGRVFALMSTSPGPGGGSRHLSHLQAIIEDIGGTVAPNPVSIPNAYTAFNEDGTLKDAQQKAALEKEIKEALQTKLP